jgi:hypothetical protein
LLQGGRHYLAPLIHCRKYGIDFLVQASPRPSVKEELAEEMIRIARRERGRFHTKSPKLQISTELSHFILRITSGARYGTGMAFPLCSLPTRACPRSQMVSGPAPPSIYRET